MQDTIDKEAEDNFEAFKDKLKMCPQPILNSKFKSVPNQVVTSGQHTVLRRKPTPAYRLTNWVRKSF